MVNYNNGKIYKIVCDTTGLMYVGSTTKQYLSQRLDSHRSKFKGWKNGNHKEYTTSFKVLENDNFTIVLLELVNCETKDQLTARERFYIESNVCVNKNIPTRTQKEYDEANKEKKKEYRETNKEQITEYQKEYRETNKEAIAENQKEYRESNKEKITEIKKTLFTCECGSTIRKNDKARHFNSKKHMVFCQPSI